MGFQSILVANRGEIAIRIMRAANDLGISAVAVYSEDDPKALHRAVADQAVALKGRGVPAYLNMDGIIEAAKESNCDAIHPGYGFLAENAAFARKCAENGIAFIGPDVDHLELFGDKGRARAAASHVDVPILKGIDRSVSLEEAREFYDSLGGKSGMMIKAVAGGGGRGTRAVTNEADIEDAYNRCRSEANIAFGNDELYVEEFLERARHIEVQILGDKSGNIVHLGERECTLQRRHQKVLEEAPPPGLPSELLAELEAYAPLVTPGSYCIVYDTVIEDLPETSAPGRPWGQGDSPKTAVIEYLARLADEGRTADDGRPLRLEVDETVENKLLITVAPHGYLRRLGPPS